MNRRRLFPLALVAATLIATALAYGGDDSRGTKHAQSETVTIEIENLKFVPADLVVAPGTTIRWINLDQVDHDVTSGKSLIGRATRGMAKTKFPDDKFASGLFGKDKSFSVTFDKKGEYQYYCDIHPFMIARIVVE